MKKVGTMATIETVEIRFRSSGARVIKRKLDELGAAADKTTRSIFLLKRAMYVIGGAGIITGLVNYADALTSMENRLRLTSKSTAELEAVQSELFTSAKNARADVIAMSDVYNRMALSAKNLGAGQREMLDFTESLFKAATISGASAQEANAALVQLGQGLASNRLSGDELRSILEQLPYVADIIARQLGVTRGELRKLGSDGKISAGIVLDAFKNMKGEIDTLFDQTSPTIAQAFNVAKTNLLQFIDRVEDAAEISTKFAKAIIAISDNIGFLAGLLLLLAGRYALAFGATVLSKIMLVVAGVKRAGLSTAALAAIEAQRARTLLALRAAQAASTSAEAAAFAVRQARLTQTLALAQAEYANAAAAFRNGRAYGANGRFIAMSVARDRLTAATIRLTAIEKINNVTSAKNTALAAANTAAMNAQTAAATRLAGAKARLNSIAVFMSATFPILTGVIKGTTAAIKALFILLAANPILALIAVIATLILTILTLGERIAVTADGLISLRDAGIAAFQLMSEAVGPYITIIRDELGSAFQFVSDILGDVASDAVYVLTLLIKGFIDFSTFVPRILIGTFYGITLSIKAFAANSEAYSAQFSNFFITAFELMANSWVLTINLLIAGVNKLIKAVGATNAAKWFGLEDGQIKDLEAANFKKYEVKFSQGAKSLGDAFKEGFMTVFEGGSADNILATLDDVWKKIIDRARLNAKNAAKVTDNDRLPGPDTPGEGRSFSDIIKDLRVQIDLQKLSTEQRKISNEILGFEKELKRELTEIERNLASELLLTLERETKKAEIISNLRDEMSGLIEKQGLYNELLIEGRLTVDEYNNGLFETNNQMRELRMQLGEGSFSDGFLTELQTMTEGIQSFKSSAGQAFGQFFNTFTKGFADSVGAAIMGTKNFGEAMKDVARSAVQQLISSLVQLGIQYLINQALGLTSMAASTAATVAAGSAAAAAWAPAAAAASLASFGANAAPAAAGMTATYALGKALSLIPGMKDGGYVGGEGGPRDDKVVKRLSNGEFVNNAESTRKNRKLLEFMNDGGDMRNVSSGGDTYHLSISVQAQDADSFSASSGQIMEKADSQFRNIRRRNRS
jgi:tape measure domain-containing protein